jgi:hypothetical protein
MKNSFIISMPLTFGTQFLTVLGSLGPRLITFFSFSIVEIFLGEGILEKLSKKLFSPFDVKHLEKNDLPAL